MEKRPVVIEGTFEDVVRRFHTEMQKGKKNFSYCGEMPGQDAQNKTLVRRFAAFIGRFLRSSRRFLRQNRHSSRISICDASCNLRITIVIFHRR